MVRYQEVLAQNVVLYYVLMEFGNRTCAYLYQVADVLWVVLVRVVPVQVQNFSTGWFFQKKSVQGPFLGALFLNVRLVSTLTRIR